MGSESLQCDVDSAMRMYRTYSCEHPKKTSSTPWHTHAIANTRSTIATSKARKTEWWRVKERAIVFVCVRVRERERDSKEPRSRVARQDRTKGCGTTDEGSGEEQEYEQGKTEEHSFLQQRHAIEGLIKESTPNR